MALRLGVVTRRFFELWFHPLLVFFERFVHALAAVGEPSGTGFDEHHLQVRESFEHTRRREVTQRVRREQPDFGVVDNGAARTLFLLRERSFLMSQKMMNRKVATLKALQRAWRGRALRPRFLRRCSASED